MNYKQSGSPAPKKYKRTTGMMAGALALCLLMSGCVSNEPGSEQEVPGNETEITQPIERNPNADSHSVVIQLGEKTLDNKILSYYYWDMYYYVGYILGGLLDLSTPLDQQEYMDGQSWHDLLQEMALENWVRTQEILRLGQEEDFVMSEEYQTDYESAAASLETDAADQGYESADEYLKDNFGDYADMDSYMSFLWDAYYTSAFNQTKQEEIYNQVAVTAEITYVDTVNVRHILISNETEDAETVAQEIYEAWQSTGTEEEFAALANEYSEDPGSNTTGGLYENVTQGMMVDTFDQWIFDKSRQVGDSGIVETTYGYHIMYYSGLGEPVESSIDAEVEEKYSAWLSDLIENAEYTTYLENVLISGGLHTRTPVSEG